MRFCPWRLEMSSRDDTSFSCVRPSINLDRRATSPELELEQKAGNDRAGVSLWLADPLGELRKLPQIRWSYQPRVSLSSVTEQNGLQAVAWDKSNPEKANFQEG